MQYAKVRLRFVQNEPKSIVNAYNIWKSTTNSVELYIEGVIDNNIGKFQRKKSVRFSAAVLYASDLFFLTAVVSHLFHSLRALFGVCTTRLKMIYLNFITLIQVE